MRTNVARLLLFLGLITATFACAERQLPVEPLSVPVKARTLITPPPPISGLHMTVPPDGTPAYSASLPTFPDSLIAEFSVDGLVYAFRTPQADVNKYSGSIDARGYFRSGFSGCWSQVVFTYTGGIWGPGPCSGGAHPTLYVDTVAIQGQGTVRRSGAIFQETYECNYTVCWTYSGDQTYGIKPLSAAINLTTPGTVEAAPGTIEKPQPGNWTLFKVTANPVTIKNIQVPIKVLSWTWTAASGGAGQTVLTGGATAIQRSVYIQEEGRMVVDAIVNGAEQIDTVSVVVPVIKIVLQNDSMLPSIQTPGRNEPSTQTLNVSVSGFNGVPLPNKPIGLSAIASEGTAGHSHTGGKPTGGFLPEGGSTKQINTGPTGVTTVTFKAPDPSGPVTIRGTSSAATTANKIVVVRVPGLVSYGPTAHYDTTGGTPTHMYTMNHYVEPAHLTKLNIFADRFFAKFGTRPIFNDSSLPMGGLFDVGQTLWTYPHKAHRQGRNTDLKTSVLTTAMRNFADEQWHLLGGDLCDETVNLDGSPNTVNPHYHLIYPGKC